MNIQRVFSLFFVCSLSPSIINYACPNFRTTCSMALMLYISAWVWYLNDSCSIPSNDHVNSCCNSPKPQWKVSYDHVQVFHRQAFLSYRKEFMFEMCLHGSVN